MHTKTFVLHVTVELPLTCPSCQRPTGFLFREEGVCLACVLEAEDVARFEEREKEAFWGAAEMAVPVCSVD